MKIACIAYLHGFGGAERQIINLANYMAERGHNVHLIAIAECKISYVLNSNIVLHSLEDVERGNYLKRLFVRRKALIEILTKLKCDITVHFNFQSAYFLAPKSKKKIGKVIYSERGDPGDKEYSGLLSIVRKIAIHGINGFVFQSEGARNYFKQRHIIKNSIVIPNACFIKKSAIRDKVREKRIVTVGRLSQQKNQALLIKAFAKIKDLHCDYELDIYGDGPLKTELENLSLELGVSEKVNFRGTSSSVLDKIRSASLFVLSSDFEGIPNALIEAMAIGVPCISTDCKPGGARALITNGQNGIITPIKNVDKLAEAIDYMLSHPIERELMASNAINIIDSLSPKTIYDSWENFLKRIISD